jgi:hypothetical protein
MKLARTASVIFAVIVLLSGSSAHAQSPLKMKVTLGQPPALEIELTYQDPSDLFALLAGGLVMPVWVNAKNVSVNPVSLDAKDVALSLGGAQGVIRLSALDADRAQREIEKTAKLPSVLRAIAGQGADWGPNPYRARFPDGTLAPGKSKRGFIFFLRPAGLQFDGFMTISTGMYAAELLDTASVKSTIRSGSSAAATVVNVINSVMGRVLYGTPPFGRSYALLFAISDYKTLDKLDLVRRDLARMSEFLNKQGFDKVVVVANRDVTASTLRNIQAHFQNEIRPEDRLLVYYSGHGARPAGGDTGYLVLADSAGTTPNPRTEVSMRDFMSWIMNVKVKHLLVLLDACHSGSAIGGQARTIGESLDGTTRERLYELSSDGGRFVITAGDAEQNAHEDRRWDGGLFTNAVLQALKPKSGSEPRQKLVTTFELYIRVKEFVAREVDANKLTKQTPLIQDLGYTDGRGTPAVSKGEFVFVTGS